VSHMRCSDQPLMSQDLLRLFPFGSVRFSVAPAGDLMPRSLNLAPSAVPLFRFQGVFDRSRTALVDPWSSAKHLGIAAPDHSHLGGIDLEDGGLPEVGAEVAGLLS